MPHRSVWTRSRWPKDQRFTKKAAHAFPERVGRNRHGAPRRGRRRSRD